MKTLPVILKTFSISKKPHLKVIKGDFRALQIAKLQTEIKNTNSIGKLFLFWLEVAKKKKHPNKSVSAMFLILTWKIANSNRDLCQKRSTRRTL